MEKELAHKTKSMVLRLQTSDEILVGRMFKAKVALEGKRMKDVLLDLLRNYSNK